MNDFSLRHRIIEIRTAYIDSRSLVVVVVHGDCESVRRHSVSVPQGKGNQTRARKARTLVRIRLVLCRLELLHAVRFPVGPRPALGSDEAGDDLLLLRLERGHRVAALVVVVLDWAVGLLRGGAEGGLGGDVGRLGVVEGCRKRCVRQQGTKRRRRGD